MSLRRRTTTLAIVSAIGVAGLAGCGGNDSGDDRAASSPAARPSATTSSPTPSAGPSASGSASPSASPSSPGPGSGPLSTVDALLTARAMPGFDDSWQWSVQRTTVDPTRVGTCSRVPMQTLGADEAVTRVFVPTGDDGGGTARQVVARLVDDRSADQAQSVLETSRATCRSRLTGFASVDVAAPELVDVSHGQASWYLTRTVRRGAQHGHFNALGVLRAGTTIELIELDVTGKDYDYPAGQEPVVLALKRAARLLG